MPQHRSHLRCFSLLVVVPLLSLASASQMPPHCADKEMTCFLNTKCIDTTADEDGIFYSKHDTKMCKVHIEIKPYNTKKALIRLKTKEEIIKVAYKGEEVTPLFGCESYDVNGEKKIRPTGTQELLAHENWQNTGLSCEFIYENDPLFDVSKKPVIQYGTSSNLNSIEGTKNVFWNHAEENIKCDSDWLVGGFTSDDKFKYEDPDKRFNKITCTQGMDLVFENDEGKAEAADVIECKNKGGNKWEYDITAKEGGKRFAANAPETKKVGCRSIGCKQCLAVDEIPAVGCDSCTKPALAEIDGCDILKCGRDRIRVDGDNATIGRASCGAHKDIDGTTTFRWMLNNKPIEKIACAPEVFCQHVTPLVVEGGVLNMFKAKVTCEDGQTIKVSSSDKPTTSLLCDGPTGKWTTGEGVEVPAGTAVSCIVPEEVTQAVAGAAMGAAETAAVAVVGVVIVAVICMLIFCFVYKPKKRAAKEKKAKTTTEKQDKSNSSLNLHTALPVGYVPPPSATNSDNNAPVLKVAIPAADLVEKTMIAHTPDTKESGVQMNTAILPATTPTEDVEVRAQGHSTDRKEKKVLMREQSDGSEPRSVKIGKNGELIRDKKKGTKKGEDSQSEAGSTKKDDKKPGKPEDTGPKPRVFDLNEKEEKIRKGATAKQSDYPTFADIQSDWDDNDEEKRKEDEKKAAAAKGKRGKTQDNAKTVPTAVTPEVPGNGKPSVDRTQLNTRNSVDNNPPESGNMDNLVTQLDTTVEQKEADAKKK